MRSRGGFEFGKYKTDFTKTKIIWEITKHIPSQISNPMVDLSFDFTGMRYQASDFTGRRHGTSRGPVLR